MLIKKEREENTLIVKITGRLDSASAPECEAEILPVEEGVDELILDLERLDYISSAGLRVLLLAQKEMMTKGEMKVIHVQETVLDILDITGFTSILTIEE